MVALLCAALLSLPMTLLAQDDKEGPWQLSPDELEQQGWHVSGSERAPGSVGCGLWGVLVSTVWHGWAHRCAGDNESHYRLLAMEATGLGLMASAVVIAVLSNDADTLNPVWSGLFFTGGVAFVTSYLFDIFGTFKGSARELYANERNENGISSRLFMRWVPADPFELNVLFGAELPIRGDWFWVVPKGMMDVIDFQYWRLGVELGGKFWRGESRATYLALVNETRYESFPALGFNVLTTIPIFEASVDVGLLLPHLEGLFFVTRVGYGFEFYDWEDLGSDEAFTDRSSLFVLESELSLNLLDSVNLAVTYSRRPDMLIGGLSRATRLWGLIPTPGFGSVGFDLAFQTDAGWSAEFDIVIGTMVEFWVLLGTRF